MRRLATGLAGCALLAGLLTGCTSARSSLGTSDDSCYLALPAASHAVGSDSRLIGIHLYSMSELRKKVPHLYAYLSAANRTSGQVCVAAFSGHFTAGGVSKPLGRASGRLAVVVSASPSNKLLGTVIFRDLPLHFGHPHIG